MQTVSHTKTHSLTEALTTMMTACVEQFPVPSVSTVVMPEGKPDAGYKYSRFGLLTLSDGASGFFYRLLHADSAATDDIQRLTQSISAPGKSLHTLVDGYTSEEAATREIGMATINAVSQHLFTRCGLNLADPRYSLEHFAQSQRRDHSKVGMVGYFSPLVARLQANGTPLVVLELDETLHQETQSLLVTSDKDALRGCDHVICTASTLLNHSLDALLAVLGDNCFFELIGPTAGCLPDALFERGVSAVGGSCVVSLSAASERIATMQPWGNSVVKYVLTPQNYPGVSDLLSRYHPPTKH